MPSDFELELLQALGPKSPTPRDRLFSGVGFSAPAAYEPFGPGQMEFLQEKLGGRAVSKPQSEVGTFFESMAHAAGPGIFGALPSLEVQQWREENPYASFFSQALGETPAILASTLIGGAAFGAARTGVLAGRLGKALNTVNTLSSPFKRGLIREPLLLAPLQIARMAGSPFAGEGAFERSAERAAFETIGVGLLGGGIGALRGAKGTPAWMRERQFGTDAAPVEAELREIGQHIQNFDLNAPLQNLYSQVVKAQAAGQLPPEMQALVPKVLSGVKSKMYAELSRTPTKYVRPLSIGGASAGKRLNQLFTGSAKFWEANPLSRKQLANETDEAYKAYLREAIPAQRIFESIAPEDWPAFTQFPRLVKPKDAERLLNTISTDMRKVRDGSSLSDLDALWMAEEADNGLYVGLQRVMTPEGPKWFTFKTGSPKKWAPDAAGLIDRMTDVYVRTEPKYQLANPEAFSETGTPFLSTSLKMWERADPAMARAIGTDDPNAAVAFLQDSLSTGSKEAFAEARRISGNLGLSLRGPAAPRTAEFTGSVRARMLDELTKQVFDEADRRLTVEMFGTQVGQQTGSLFRQIVRGGQERILGEITELRRVAGLSPRHFEEIKEAWMAGMVPEEAAAEGFLPEVVNWLKFQQKRDISRATELKQTWKALGSNVDFTPEPAHYGLSRTWIGSWRIPLFAEVKGLEGRGDLVVGFATGRGKTEAQREAHAIIKAINDIPGNPEGRLRAYDEKFSIDRFTKTLSMWQREAPGTLPSAPEELTAKQADLLFFSRMIDLSNPLVNRVMKMRAQLAKQVPARTRPSRGLFGYAGTHGGREISLKDFETALLANARETYRTMAKDITLSRGLEQATRLGAEDPVLATRYMRRLFSSAGVNGPVVQGLSQAADFVLAPAFGDKAMERAVNVMNELGFALTLGFMDMGFPLVNALTPIQTVLPELAFTLSVPVDRLAAYYSAGLLPVQGGLRPFSWVDPMKMMRVGIRDMLEPDDALNASFRRALDERVIGPRFVEEVVGQDSRMARRLVQTGTLTAPGENVWRNLENLIATPAAISEELSRGFSFVVGRRVAKDFFGLDEERAYQFAKQFVTRTNFGYSTQDRARLMTGWLGTGWGLFKNWANHYLWNLGAYTSAAGRGHFFPLLYAMAGTGTIGGAAAVPLFSVANGLAHLMTDKEMSELVYDAAGGNPVANTGADLFMYGMPSLMGLSLQGRASAPTSSILRDMELLAGSLTVDRAVALGTALGSGITAMSRGENPFNYGAFNRAWMRALAPRTIQRAFQTVGQDGVMSLNTGNRLMPSPGLVQQWSYILGLTPLDVEKHWALSNIAYSNREQKMAKLDFWGEMLKDARLNNDPGAVRRTFQGAIRDGVNMESLIKSSNTRVYKSNTPFYEEQFNNYQDQRRKLLFLGSER